MPERSRDSLNILFLCSGSMPIEIALSVGKGAKLELFEWYLSVTDGPALMAPLHAVSIGDDCEVEMNLLHDENTEVALGALGKVSISEGSRFRLNAIYSGASQIKSTNIIEACGKGSAAQVSEIAFGTCEQRFDVGTFTVNSAERTNTALRSGAVLEQNAFCTMKGYAKIAKGSDDARSELEQRALVLDSGAHAQLFPEMSVDHANIDSASHSASVSQMDGDSLFYIMSRGMDEQRAKLIFVASFISKYLSGINNSRVKEIAGSVLMHKLEPPCDCGHCGHEEGRCAHDAETR